MSPRIAPIMLVAAVSLWLVASTHAQAPATDPGIAVGQRAPGFALLDQTGERRSLETLLERGKLAIVFYRSADW